MATTKITSPDLFDLGSLNTALQLPSGTTAERPTSPSTGEWRYNTDNNLIEFWDGGAWRDLQDEEIPPVPSENFNTVLYTGNGTASHSITGVGFQPDFVWIKNRDTTNWHLINDSSRGANNSIFTNSTQANQINDANGYISSFDTGGFTVTSGNTVNGNGNNLVAWCWKVNGGTTVTNNEGSVTSTIQVNQKAGISIAQVSATGTFGHGLGATPTVIIRKRLDSVSSWPFYHTLQGSLNYMLLNTQDANVSASPAAPTSTLFENDGAGTQIFYCFAEKAGYSKFGTYTGNGSSNGPIINTGFEPAMVIIKRSDSADNWSMTDNKRSTSNPRDNALFPNLSSAELTSGYSVNYLSNGFQIATSGAGVNASGGTFVYMAFAADPSSAPTLANSFNTNLYTGNGTSQSITGLGFSPSWTWIKQRNAVRGQNWYDVLRGPNNIIFSNSTGAQDTSSTEVLQSFDTDGFTLGNLSAVNASGGDYVSWNWKGSTLPTINTDGTIQSLVSANANSGFSIVKYTGTGSNATVGHGLSSAPELVITKILDTVGNWTVGEFSVLGTDGYLKLNTNDSKITATNVWNDTAPTSTVVNIGTSSATNTLNSEYISYCFHSVSGFSKIGSYIGDGGNNTGPTITTGFQPDFVMVKRSSGTSNWQIYDSVRGGKLLFPNDAAVEQNLVYVDFLSTGFMPIAPSSATGDTNINLNGSTYLYWAIKTNYSIPETQMAYLSVAGGGGASRDGGGGGGAGGLRTSWGTTSGGGSSQESDITLAAGTYTITVGSGGNITNGTTSSIAGPSLTTISCVGGGVGSGADNSYSAGNGGSGGGGAGGSYSNSGGSETANEGFAGGSSAPANTGLTCFPGAGGGGAAAVGESVSRNDNTNGGNGGAGLSVDITGTAVFYAGGGGGAINACAGATPGSGGSGVGGTGSVGGGTSNATDGATNSGGGAGGGTGAGTQGLGGSGVVILRLKTSVYSGTTTGSPTVTTDGSDTILTYTGSGTYVHS